MNSTKRSKVRTYTNKLKKLYPQCVRDQDRNLEVERYKEHKITYGEIEYDGLEKMYSHVKKMFRFNPHCFIDIGSGRGKVCLYLAQKPEFDQVIGIELVTSRYTDALGLQNSLGSHAAKVEFFNQDIFTLNLAALVNTSPVFVWISNLCFEQTVTDKIYQKIIRELPLGTIICSSNNPTSFENLEAQEKIYIPMSWSQNSQVNIYKVISQLN